MRGERKLGLFRRSLFVTNQTSHRGPTFTFSVILDDISYELGDRVGSLGSLSGGGHTQGADLRPITQ